MASITCGNCKETHQTVEGVRACYNPAIATGSCGWLSYERDRFGLIADEDGYRIVIECDALAWDDGRALVCENGHEHVWAQNRAEEGWEYAEDVHEAQRLAKAGVFPVAMDGTGIL